MGCPVGAHGLLLRCETLAHIAKFSRRGFALYVHRIEALADTSMQSATHSLRRGILNLFPRVVRLNSFAAAMKNSSATTLTPAPFWAEAVGMLMSQLSPWFATLPTTHLVFSLTSGVMEVGLCFDTMWTSKCSILSCTAVVWPCAAQKTQPYL